MLPNSLATENGFFLDVGNAMWAAVIVERKSQ